MTEGSDDWYCLAVHPREERVALYEGPQSFEYPITFDGILGDGLEVDSEIRRMWFEMFGWHWVIAEVGTDEADVIEQTVSDLRDGVNLLEAFKDGATDLGAVRCNHCDNLIPTEGTDGTMGPTCPDCGHPANDPKVSD